MRQRLGVARCLLADPELLILDEPMNGLDPAGILELRTMISELVGEGRTVFLSSHLLDEVEKTCDAAAVIDRGRLIAQGPIASLLSQERCGARHRLRGAGACARPARCRSAVYDAHESGDGVRVTLAIADGAAAINGALVGAGIAVFRLEPVRESLEQRFLEMTSRVGGE